MTKAKKNKRIENAEVSLDKCKLQLLDILFEHVSVLVQSSNIKSYKDIDFLINDLNDARKTYSDIMKANNKINARKAINDWIQYDEEE